MKFFTGQWWLEEQCSNSDEIFKLYKQHLEAISDLLPQSFLNLYTSKTDTLHDSRIKEIESTEEFILIKFKGWDINFTKTVSFQMEFSGSSYFDILNFNSNELSELDDLGYWELDVRGGKVCFSAIFASGAELVIHCDDMIFKKI